MFARQRAPPPIVGCYVIPTVSWQVVEDIFSVFVTLRFRNFRRYPNSASCRGNKGPTYHYLTYGDGLYLKIMELWTWIQILSAFFAHMRLISKAPYVLWVVEVFSVY
jgi:hypothetical protein